MFRRILGSYNHYSASLVARSVQRINFQEITAALGINAEGCFNLRKAVDNCEKTNFKALTHVCRNYFRRIRAFIL